MCGRASGSRGPAALAAATGSRRFLAAARYRPSYNLGPTNTLPVLRRVLTKHHTHHDADVDVESKGEQQHDDDDDDVSRDDHSLERDRKYNREDEDEDGDGNGDGPSGSSRDLSTSNNEGSSTSTLSSSSGSSSSSDAPSDANAPEQHTLETDLNTMEPDFKGLNAGDLILQSMSWGLVPFYTAKDQIHSTGYNMINARAETVAQKGTFKRLLSRHRCVVVVDGYYEWHTSTNKLGQIVKQPYFMQHKHRETKPIDTKDEDDELQSAPSSAVPSAAEWVYPSALMYMAALWDRWIPKDGDTASTPFYTVTILTTEPIQSMGWMHDRQPVILSARQAAMWCDVENIPFSQVASFMSPHPLDLEWYPVTDTVSQIRNKSKECVEHKDVVMARRHATGLGRFFKPANASPSKATSDSSSSSSTTASSSSTSTSTSASTSSTSSTSSCSTSTDAPSATVARAKSPVFVIDDDEFPSPQKPQRATSPSNNKSTAATDTDTSPSNTKTASTDTFPSPRNPAPTPTPITKTTPNKKRKTAPLPTGSQSIASMFSKISKQKVDSVQSIRERHRALMEED